MEKLTIDANVVLAAMRPDEANHKPALKILALHATGHVELQAATSGFVRDMQGALADDVRAYLARHGVAESVQLAYPGVAYPGFYPGAGVPGFPKVWQDLIDTWPTHESKPPGIDDRLHVETHVLECRDVFVTDDRPLLIMCRRLGDEKGIPVTAMSIRDYVTRWNSSATPAEMP